MDEESREKFDIAFRNGLRPTKNCGLCGFCENKYGEGMTCKVFKIGVTTLFTCNLYEPR